MRIDILTLFPKMFEAILSESILKRAQEAKLIKINFYNLRNFSHDKHKKVDDRPFGGGPGMVLRPEPIFEALESITEESKIPACPSVRRGCSCSSGRRAASGKAQKSIRTILLSPHGKKFDQKLAKKFSKFQHLILICGHYEGVDERVRKNIVTDEVSVGDYVLTGGELPAMILIDAIVRLIPGVLGNEASANNDSFNEGLLEYPQYTRPAIYRGMKVPDVLLSGNHRRIEAWRLKQALNTTLMQRPDLLKKELKRNEGKNG